MVPSQGLISGGRSEEWRREVVRVSFVDRHMSRESFHKAARVRDAPKGVELNDLGAGLTEVTSPPESPSVFKETPGDI
jgi:hypothetical protein